jgi:hypothetical protein
MIAKTVNGTSAKAETVPFRHQFTAGAVAGISEVSTTQTHRTPLLIM